MGTEYKSKVYTDRPDYAEILCLPDCSIYWRITHEDRVD